MREIYYYISKIPDGTLYELIGGDVHRAIESYYINEPEKKKPDYARILLIKYGRKILFQKEVFQRLIWFLDEGEIESIREELGWSSQLEIEQVRKKLSNKRFGYGSHRFSGSILKALELDQEKYFPPRKIVEKNYEQVTGPQYPLHQYQKNVKDETITYLLDPQASKRLLIHMPTGSGKTKTTMEIISDYIRCRPINTGFEKKTGIVWLAHTKELCQQSSESFRMTWDLRGDTAIDIYDLYGDNEYPKELLNSDKFIVFAGFQKLHALRKSNKELQNKISKKLRNNTNLVVVDEAHKSLATTYSDLINYLTKSNVDQQLIGLTATPGRKAEDDVENKMLANFYRSNKITLTDEFGIKVDNPIKYLQDIEILAKLNREELYSEVELKFTEEELKQLKLYGDEKLSKILNQLSIHPGRNQKIITRIEQSVNSGESVLVFGCGVDHCIILESLLAQLDIEAKSVLGQTSKPERNRIISDFKDGELRVLINYGVLTTGFDAPNLDTVVITRPTTSIVLYSQMLGRALRGPRNGGNYKNTVVDIKDNFGKGSTDKMFSFFNEIWN